MISTKLSTSFLQRPSQNAILRSRYKENESLERVSSSSSLDKELTQGLGIDQGKDSPDKPDTDEKPSLNPPESPQVDLKRDISTIALPHYRAIHVNATPSLLSKGGDPVPSYAGFQNLGMIVVAAGNLRLIIENYQHYGFIRSVYRIGISKNDLELMLLLTACIPLHLFGALLIEKLAAITGKLKVQPQEKEGTIAPKRPKKHLWTLFAALHFINVVLIITVSSYVVYTSIWHPVVGTICEIHAVIVCLKVASYALTNRDLRDAYLDGNPTPELYESQTYPNNLTINSLVYFWWAPTLLYQPVYPRTDRIRLGFVLARLFEMVGSAGLIWFLSGQYATPILQNSIPFFKARDWIAVSERLLKLSTVSMVIWLLGFFCVFQSYLNLLAELMRFGDRDFYQDWWNSGSVGTYWKLWNKPVTNYFRRHIYIPLLKRGWSSTLSSFAVFFVSAVLHEVLVGIPTHNIIGVAFFCMLLQVPLVAVTAPLEKMRGPATSLGNCIFWLSFFLGQPTAVLLYYFAWNVKYADQL